MPITSVITRGWNFQLWPSHSWDVPLLCLIPGKSNHHRLYGGRYIYSLWGFFYPTLKYQVNLRIRRRQTNLNQSFGINRNIYAHQLRIYFFAGYPRLAMNRTSTPQKSLVWLMGIQRTSEMEISWNTIIHVTNHRSFMEISWNYHGNIMNISWKYHEHIMEISWIT